MGDGGMMLVTACSEGTEGLEQYPCAKVGRTEQGILCDTTADMIVVKSTFARMKAVFLTKTE